MGKEAVSYSRILRFCGGSWNLTLKNVRDDYIEKCGFYFFKSLYLCYFMMVVCSSWYYCSFYFDFTLCVPLIAGIQCII